MFIVDQSFEIARMAEDISLTSSEKSFSRLRINPEKKEMFPVTRYDITLSRKYSRWNSSGQPQ